MGLSEVVIRIRYYDVRNVMYGMLMYANVLLERQICPAVTSMEF